MVSHDLEFVKHSCQKIIWLDHGEVKYMGDAQHAVQSYLTGTVIPK